MNTPYPTSPNEQPSPPRHHSGEHPGEHPPTQPIHPPLPAEPVVPPVPGEPDLPPAGDPEQKQPNFR